MRTATKTIALLMAVLLLCIGSMLVTRAAEKAPSIEAITAALVHQDKGADVDVRYTESYKAGKVLVYYHYIRTGEAISLELDIRGGSAAARANTPVKYSYDRTQNETRSISKSKSGTPVTGSIKTGLGGMLAVQAMLDGARDPVGSLRLGGTVLYESISRYGKVGTAMVDIDGHMCWPVAIKFPSPDTGNSMTACLDPSIGFNPRAVKVIRDRAWPTRLEDASFGDYREIVLGVWFPNKKSIGKSTFKVTALRTDLHPAKDDIIIKFPHKARVIVNSKEQIEIP